MDNYKGAYEDVDLTKRLITEKINTGSITEVTDPDEIKKLVLNPANVVNHSSKPRLLINPKCNTVTKKRGADVHHLGIMLPEIGLCKCAFTSDGKSMYDQVPISESSSMFFGFKFENSYYKYKSLPYGWRCSAFVTQALNNQICMWMRSKGHLIFIFIIISAKYTKNNKKIFSLNLFKSTFSSSLSVSTILNPLIKHYFAKMSYRRFHRLWQKSSKGGSLQKYVDIPKCSFGSGIKPS